MASYFKIPHLCVGFIIIIAHASWVSSCPTIVSRSDWGAAKTIKTVNRLKVNPPPLVFIHHTAGRGCHNRDECSAQVRGTQSYHMNGRGYSDIGYSFLIGGDGAVYEGRGWGKEGAHTPPWNGQSIGISFIGDFSHSPPSMNMLNAAKDLIACGVSLGYISSKYKLHGHRQTKGTECPGEELYKSIRSWKKWSPEWLYETEKCEEIEGTCQDSFANCTGGHYVGGKCPGPSYVQCCVPCPVAPLDIQFLLDESGSILPENFEIMKSFVKDFAESFEFGPDKVLFGLVTFADEVRSYFRFNTFSNESDVLAAIDGLSYAEEGTNTHIGLDFVREVSFTDKSGDRPDATNVLFVITDGQSNHPEETVSSAKKLHQTDVVVLAVGVGEEYNVEELKAIASSETNVFHVDSFVALKNIAGDLRKPFCEDDSPKDSDFPEWGVIALSVGGTVIVLGAISGVAGIMWVKAKAAAGAAAGAA